MNESIVFIENCSSPLEYIHLDDPRVVGSLVPLGIVCLLIIFGNIMVIAAVKMTHKLRGATNLFIVSLAWADLMLGIVVLPFSAMYEVFQIWIFGTHWCAIWLAVDVWMCTASILHLVVISLDRYIAVTYPVTYPNIMSSRRAKLLILGAWVLSFVICFPPLVGWNDRELIFNNTALAEEQRRLQEEVLERCQPQCKLIQEPGYVIYSAVGSFYAPMLVMMFFNWKIYRTATKTTRAIHKGWTTVKVGHEEMGMGIHRGGTGASTRNNGSSISLMTNKARSNSNSIMLKQYSSSTPRINCVNEAKIRRKGNSTTEVELGAAIRARDFDGIVMEEETKLLMAAGKSRVPNTSLLTVPDFNPLKRKEFNHSCRHDHQQHQHHHHHNHNHHHCGSDKTFAECGTQTGDKSDKPDSPLQKTKCCGLEKRGESSDISSFNCNCFKSSISSSSRSSLEVQTTTKTKKSNSKFERRRNSSEDWSDGQQSPDASMDNLCTASNAANKFGNNNNNNSGSSRSSNNHGSGKFGRRNIKSQVRRFRMETKAAKTLGIIVGCFICCWFPFFTMYLITAFCQDCIPTIIFSIIFWLGYCNSALNPFIYAMFSREFRGAFKKILCKLLCRKTNRAGSGLASLGFVPYAPRMGHFDVVLTERGSHAVVAHDSELSNSRGNSHSIAK